MDHLVGILHLLLEALCDVGEGRDGLVHFVRQLLAIQVSLHGEVAVCVEEEIHVREWNISQKGYDTILDQREWRR